MADTFITLEFRRKVQETVFEKGEQFRLRSDGPCGRSYLDAVSSGARTFILQGREVPIGLVSVIYQGDDLAAATPDDEAP